MVEIPRRAKVSGGLVRRLIPVDEVEELPGQRLIFERRQLESGEQSQRLALTDLERPVTSPCSVIPPAVHASH